MKLLALLILSISPVSAAERLSVTAKGGFDAEGRLVEFSDHFGWRSYEATFSFGLEEDGKTLTRDSKLDLAVVSKNGARRHMACRAKKGDLSARVISIGGRQSVIADCRLSVKDFARAVELHHEDVGAPIFVFEAVIEGGHVRPGGQRGLYFRPDTPVLSSILVAYAGNGGGSGLAVLFGAQ